LFVKAFGRSFADKVDVGVATVRKYRGAG